MKFPSQNEAVQQLKIVTDYPFWEYLAQGQKKGHKQTRVEAFYDLIGRQVMALMQNDDDYVEGNLTELAKTWGWNRETVSKFLDTLEQMGMLQIYTSMNRKFLKLQCVSR